MIKINNGLSRAILVRFLMKLQIPRQIFEKSPNIKFHENPSSGSRVVPCGRTDRHDEANSRFPQFYERAQKYVKLNT